MTLLINEIHIQKTLTNSLIISAADSRITVAGKFHSNRKKIFEIPYLNAGIGYFGLAQINQTTFLSEWLPNFINQVSDVKNIETFSKTLLTVLNHEVDKEILKNNPSGFHICGYNENKIPELWFIRNIGRMEGPIYDDFRTEYMVSEDFFSRDAINSGLVGKELDPNCIYKQFYINGDVRPFHSIWRRLDKFISEMFSWPDFRSPNYFGNPDDIKEVVKWKMTVISSFYKKFAQRKIIGSPIDVLIFTPTSTRKSN